LEAVKKFNYRPNSIARSLIQKKSYTIGLMLPDIADPFFSNIAVGVESALSKNGYQVVYGSTFRKKEKEKKFLESVFDRKMDGVIITPDNIDDELISILKMIEVPVVFLRRRTPGKLDIPFVDVDHYTGACNAVEHLINKGHKSICFMGMTEDSFISNERLRGYIDTMKKHGFYPAEEKIEIAGRTTDSGKVAMSKLYLRNKEMTALFASNDLLAIGALEWLAINNIKVPQQIALIGFDDLEFSKLHWIQLTTMSQPRKTMGYMAGEMLLKMINGSNQNESVLLKASLVERRTC
jgi:LacI family transcriptional regulator